MELFDLGLILATIQRTLADTAFWIGLITVAVFALGRFNELQSDIQELDPPILIRSFTTKFRYYLAAYSYTGIYVALYFVLICIGSLPKFQELLKSWIGTVPDAQIGSPAWAAMAATALLPALPIFQRLDKTLRLFLQDFASIPHKIRRLAEEMRFGIASMLGHDGAAVEAQVQARIFETLQEKIGALKNLRNSRSARAYLSFFREHEAVHDTLETQFETIKKEMSAAGTSAAAYAGQLAVLSNRLSRFVACALLHASRDEYEVRRVLSRDLKIPGIQQVEWRFTSSQIVLGMVLVLVCMVAGAVLSSVLWLRQTPGTEIEAGLVRFFATRSTALGLLAVPMFMLPLIFAAGTQMYLIDRKVFGDELEWHQQAVALVLTFIGALGLAFLPALIIAALGVSQPRGAVIIGQIAPWALPPAAVATLFVGISRFDIGLGRLARVALDFSAHALVAGLTSILAFRLSGWAGFMPEEYGIPTEYLFIAVPVTSGLIGGTMGALQCGISRQLVLNAPAPLAVAPDPGFSAGRA